MTSIETMQLEPITGGAQMHLERILDRRGEPEVSALREEENEKQISLLSLPEELLCRVTSFLDAGSLWRIRNCNRMFFELASRNEAGWHDLCRHLWADKVHVCDQALKEIKKDSKKGAMSAYFMSTRDAEERQCLTKEEFCYNEKNNTGTVWSFRFKESAGSLWTSLDPWYSGQPSRKVVFLKNGSVKEYIPPKAGQAHPRLIIPNWGFDDDNNNTQQQNHNGVLVDPPQTMAWRFLTRPMDLPARPMGSYVRFSIAGRDVPTYAVRRSPTGNWGFVMESCWGLYTSFELPLRRPLHPERRRLRRTDDGGRWVALSQTGEELYTSQQNRQGNDSDVLLIDDQAMAITNDIQWREAFLYNIGARILPEGDRSYDDFDREYFDGRAGAMFD